MEPKFLEANGLRFAYLEEGAGPLVLLLHGFPDTAHTWDDVRPRIAARGFRAVSPFMRGYHPTAVPASDADAETLARDVIGLIDALGEKDAVVVGHDWGALASYGAAALAPAKMRKLVTVAIPHPVSWIPWPWRAWGSRHFLLYRSRNAPARFAKDDFAELPKIYRRWSPAWAPAPEEFADVRRCFAQRESLHAAFGYYRRFSIPPPRLLRNVIEVPAVSFAGLHDGVAKPNDYRIARRGYAKNYVIEEMPGGHFLHREHPEEFAKRLLAHL